MRASLITTLLFTASLVHAERSAWFQPWAGVWYPGGQETDYYNKNIDVYRADVTAAFASNRALASEVCAWSSIVQPSETRYGYAELRSVLVELCRDVPFSVSDRYKVVDRLVPREFREITDKEERRKAEVNEWLRSRMRFELDAAAQLTADERRREFERAYLPYSLSSFEDFGRALRLMALRPQDDRAAFNALRAVKVAPYKNPPGIREEEALAFITSQFTTGSDGKDHDALLWRRGLRALRFYSGDDDTALRIGQELLKLPPSEERSRDQLFVAVIQHIKGKPEPLKTLLANCPPPDVQYTQTKTASAVKAAFCEDVVSELVRRAMQLRGKSLEEAASRILVAAASPSPETVPLPPTPRPPDKRLKYLDEYSAIVNKTLHDIEDLSEVERRAYYWKRIDRPEGRIIEIEDGLQALATQPSDVPVYFLLGHMFPHAESETEFQREALRQILVHHLKRTADDGWRLALAGFYMYTGDYTAARDTAAPLAAKKNATASEQLVVALLEAVHDNPVPLRRTMEKCPPAHEAYIERWGKPASPEAYCRTLLDNLTRRIARRLGSKTAPAITNAVLSLVRSSPLESDERFFAIDTLGRIDPKLEKIELETVLDSPTLSSATRTFVLERLQSNAVKQNDWARVAAYAETLLKELEFVPQPFTSVVWQKFASLGSAARELRPNTAALAQLSLRYQAARESKNDVLARETIEQMILAGAEPSVVLHNLREFALYRFNAGAEEEARRILGYAENFTDDRAHAQAMEGLRMAYFHMSRGERFRLEDRPWGSTKKPLDRSPDPEKLVM